MLHQRVSFSNCRCLSKQVITFVFPPEFPCSICCSHRLQRAAWRCHVPTPDMLGSCIKRGCNWKNCEAGRNRPESDKQRGTPQRCRIVRQKTRHEEIIQHKYSTTSLNHNIQFRILLVKSEWRSAIQRLLSTNTSVVLWSYTDKKRFPIPG